MPRSAIAWALDMNAELRERFGGMFPDQLDAAFAEGSAAGVEVIDREAHGDVTERWDVLIGRNGWAVKYSGELRRWHVYRVEQEGDRT